MKALALAQASGMPETELRTRIQERLSDLEQKERSGSETPLSSANDSGVRLEDLTVGLEQEFFLLGGDGLPATHEESQRFLQCLSLRPSWQVRSRQQSALGEMIERVSQDHTRGRYTAVKYDHHPHLLEVAFAYENSLIELNRSVAETFSTLHLSAREAGLRLELKPSLDLSSSHARVISPLEEFCDLRSYRARLLARRGKNIDSEGANYAAVIAATQTHVGGVRWWENASWVERLYSFEPEMLYWSSFSLGRDKDQEQVTRFLSKRWNGFCEVFEGYPLAGYPSLSQWTVEDWIDALMCSPLVGAGELEWSGSSVRELGYFPGASGQTFFSQVRDLQIIRPKLFGTLEFRADPAQPDIESILRLLAIRLGLTCLVALGGGGARSFQESHEEWWRQISSGEISRDEDLINAARFGLIARGFGEESFLNGI